jgi:tRNA(His) 5'-end guanylyltransferase
MKLIACSINIFYVNSHVAHINNLYNTTFWALVKQGNRTTQEAHGDLKGTFSKDKHAILFDRFQMNYNNEPEIFKKGSILIWASAAALSLNPSHVENPQTGHTLVKDNSNVRLAFFLRGGERIADHHPLIP